MINFLALSQTLENIHRFLFHISILSSRKFDSIGPWFVSQVIWVSSHSSPIPPPLNVWVFPEVKQLTFHTSLSEASFQSQTCLKFFVSEAESRARNFSTNSPRSFSVVKKTFTEYYLWNNKKSCRNFKEKNLRKVVVRRNRIVNVLNWPCVKNAQIL